MNDAGFAWLQPMTALIVQLDEVMDGADLGSWQELGTRARALFTADAEGSVFQQNYAARLQSSPDVGLAHAAVMRALRG